MAKQTTIAAERTIDMFGAKRRVGRPRSEHSMTNAERQRLYRASHSSYNVGDKIGVTVKSLAADFDLSEDQVFRELLRFALCNKNWRQVGFPGVCR